MRVFLTGATGFIGSLVAKELLAAGHMVLGMTRSDAGAEALARSGVEAHRATLEDPASLTAGTEGVDAVIHTAFDHDFSHFVENCEKDKRAIEALGTALKGSDRPLIITSGTGMGMAVPGELAREDIFHPDHPNPRVISEVTGQALLDSGVNVSVVRLPQVHDTERQGLVSPYIALAQAAGIAGYMGDGSNRWPAAHVSDVARLYRLALDHAAPGLRHHAVAEEGIPAIDIARAVGRGLGIPSVPLTQEQAGAHFAWLAPFLGMDMPASSAITRQRLGWNPTGPGMLEDLGKMDFSTLQVA